MKHKARKKFPRRSPFRNLAALTWDDFIRPDVVVPAARAVYGGPRSLGFAEDPPSRRKVRVVAPVRGFGATARDLGLKPVGGVGWE